MIKVTRGIVMKTCQLSLNEGTAENHVTESNWCCYCIPLRLGLFVLALFKLILSLGLLIIITFTLILFMILSGLEWVYHIIILMCIAILINLVDVFIGLVIIVSVCVKDQGIMEIYYRYSIYVFGSLSFLCCVTSYLTGYYFIIPTYIMSRHMIAMIILFCILFFILMIQVSLNHIVKKEVQRLRSNEHIRL